MTAFVNACVETAADSASAAERRARGRPRVRKLLSLLAGRKNILITTHEHPDPDALASTLALSRLLRLKLKPDTAVTVSVKGRVGGGVNEVFYRLSHFALAPWDDARLPSYDAVILLDTQPSFAFSPLPPGVVPTAVIDHHRGQGRRPTCPFCDVRTDVGATSSIVFSYFMELDVPIDPELGATLLYAIETDLAGAAGTPGDLDNVALSSLTLIADTRQLYQMRYAPLPQGYYVAYAEGLANALWWESGPGALISHLSRIDSLEKPAVLADFLLRFDKAQWVLVTAAHDGRLLMSLRSGSLKISASDMMRRLLRGLGDGGGHRTKAGGFIPLKDGSAAEIEKLRKTLRSRYLRALDIKPARGQKLVP